MRWPFVSRSAFDNLQTEINALKKKVSAATPVPHVRAGFEGGAITRLTHSFGTQSLSADREIQPVLKNLRGRSRNLAMNNGYVRKFLESLVVNVIGAEGITLQNQAKDDNGEFDTTANAAIEEQWYEWSQKGTCDVTGELSLQQALSLGLKSTARDGDFMLRKIRGWKDNKYRFAIQLIESDLLDDSYNRDLSNGNRIIMGVEKDKWGRRVAYHLLTRHPGDGIYTWAGSRYQVIPADEIIMPFLRDRIYQTRGIPWLHAVTIMLNNIGAYNEAAIINARVGASKMGFYKKLTGADGLEAISDHKTANGEFITEAEPGTFPIIPDGYEFQDWSPAYPSGEFDPFNKAMLRGVASGLLIANSTLTSDLSDVNFSSIRSGKIDERDIYRFIQTWYISETLNHIYPEWLDFALLSGNITSGKGKPLPYAKYNKFNAPNWHPRGFEWVDPQSDIEADIRAVAFGLKTRTEILASRGKDLREVFQTLKDEETLAKEYGLVLTAGKMEAAEKTKQGDAENPKKGDKENAEK